MSTGPMSTMPTSTSLMPARLLVNGVAPANPAEAIAVNDRGLNYGDGLFETALLRKGAVRFLQSHLHRLRDGCERLGIAWPGDEQLTLEIAGVSEAADEGVLKIIVTRGAGGRGYRPSSSVQATRIVALYPLPEHSTESTFTVRWCALRLSRNAMLAGMKHLNRLEQVLAQREWSDEAIGEGLMLDTEGELVCGTASNVFIVRNGVLLTPDLRFCGVRGVMRSQVLRMAAELRLQFNEEPLWPHDVESATEIFVTNAVRGIRAVTALESLRWDVGPVAQRLIRELDR